MGDGLLSLAAQSAGRRRHHLIELAIAGGADWLISANLRGLRGGEMMFPGLKIGTARQFIEETGF